MRTLVELMLSIAHLPYSHTYPSLDVVIHTLSSLRVVVLVCMDIVGVHDILHRMIVHRKDMSTCITSKSSI